MKLKYKLPIQGTVLSTNPLKGAGNDPIIVIPLGNLPGCPTEIVQTLEGVDKEVLVGFRYTCLNYDIDEEWCEVELEANEEFHNWLTDILPRLRNIQKEKSWKLDKSKTVGKPRKK